MPDQVRNDGELCIVKLIEDSEKIRPIKDLQKPIIEVLARHHDIIRFKMSTPPRNRETDPWPNLFVMTTPIELKQDSHGRLNLNNWPKKSMSAIIPLTH